MDVLAKDQKVYGDCSVAYSDDRVATITVTNVGTWASYNKMKVALEGLEFGKKYNLVITMSASDARSVKFNIGHSLNADPWYTKFTVSQDIIEITDELVQYVITFDYDKAYEANGPCIEFDFGLVVSTDSPGTITVTEMKVYEKAE